MNLIDKLIAIYKFKKTNEKFDISDFILVASLDTSYEGKEIIRTAIMEDIDSCYKGYKVCYNNYDEDLIYIAEISNLYHDICYEKEQISANETPDGLYKACKSLAIKINSNILHKIKKQNYYAKIIKGSLELGCYGFDLYFNTKEELNEFCQKEYKRELQTYDENEEIDSYEDWLKWTLKIEYENKVI